jgi:hypothetical protein
MPSASTLPILIRAIAIGITKEKKTALRGISYAR